ncbi:hypothetical protein B0H11DRAFT_2255622 [Mycena galericulata]|nr:hypothetical protein B0H11DRAFT_2255622 [Mycena galericulata]
MSRTGSAPPPYSESEAELAEILAVFDQLTINNGNVASTRVRAHPQSSPVPPAPHPPSTPERVRLYRYESPTKSGYTPHWDVAAEATQGIPGASARRLGSTSNNNKQTGGKRCGYAVFVGTQIGTFARWEDARAYVDGVGGSIHQGYPSLDRAKAAFEYARQRSWTRVIPAVSPSIDRPAPVPAAIPRLPTPVGIVEDSPNPLHAGESPGAGLWYVVYSGITPGVYQSSLECMLNTVGIPNAVHDSWRNKETAVERYEQALADGRVHIITPEYYV